MDLVNTVTIAIAAVGAVLGVINTVWALQRDRVRLQVVPVWMLAVASTTSLTSEHPEAVERAPRGRLGIRVTNVGLTEVTVDGVGITHSGFWQRRGSRRLARRPLIGDALQQVTLPHRLKARDSIVLWSAVDWSEMRTHLHDARRVYASTLCGMNVYGTTPLLRRLIRQARRDTA